MEGLRVRLLIQDKIRVSQIAAQKVFFHGNLSSVGKQHAGEKALQDLSSAAGQKPVRLGPCVLLRVRCLCKGDLPEGLEELLFLRDLSPAGDGDGHGHPRNGKQGVTGKIRGKTVLLKSVQISQVVRPDLREGITGDQRSVLSDKAAERGHKVLDIFPGGFDLLPESAVAHGIRIEVRVLVEHIQAEHCVVCLVPVLPDVARLEGDIGKAKLLCKGRCKGCLLRDPVQPGHLCPGTKRRSKERQDPAAAAGIEDLRPKKVFVGRKPGTHRPEKGKALCSQVELFHRRILCRQAVQRRVLKGIVEHGAARKIISVFRGDLLIPPPEGLLLRLCKLCPQCFLHVFDFMNPECAQDVFKTALFCFHLVSYFQCARRSSSAPMSPVFPATASRSQCAIEGRPGSVVKK